MASPEFKNGYKKGYDDGANSVEEGLPGWFGTFADMMTLLFAFFVLLGDFHSDRMALFLFLGLLLHNCFERRSG